MLFHLLINFETQMYYQNKPKFNGVYQINNLPKIKDVAYKSLNHKNSLDSFICEWQ